MLGHGRLRTPGKSHAQVLEFTISAVLRKVSYGLYIFHQPFIIVGAKIGLNSDKLAAILGNKFLAIVSLNAIAFAPHNCYRLGELESIRKALPEIERPPISATRRRTLGFFPPLGAPVVFPLHLLPQCSGSTFLSKNCA